MSILGDTSMESPIQEHRVAIANDLQWIEGRLETLGNPHNYINQENLTIFSVSDPLIAPWTFTGLPNTRPGRIYVTKASVQFLVFPDDETIDQLRQSPHTETLIINLPMAIIRGDLPFLSEAKEQNFLDFWKGSFLPVVNAGIHYLAPSAADLPTRTRLLYINRSALQSYTLG